MFTTAFPIWTVISWVLILVLMIAWGELWRRYRSIDHQLKELVTLAGRMVGGRELVDGEGYSFIDWHRLASEALLEGVFDLKNPIPHLNEAIYYESKALDVATTQRQQILAVGLIRTANDVRHSLETTMKRRPHHQEAANQAEPESPHRAEETPHP